MYIFRLNALLIVSLILSFSGIAYGENTPITLTLWPDGFLKDAGVNQESVEPDRGDGVIRVSNVSTPTMTFYPAPKADQPAPAVLICPGGGYRILAFNKEGTELAEWFNEQGVSAIVLKYRVPGDRSGAFQDAQRAMGLIRSHANAWQIDPDRVGVMGFSAGGHLAASLSTRYEERSYPVIDDADRLSCRPDFTMLIYPAYLSDGEYQLQEDIAVTASTPPCFLVQTQDDKNYIASSIAYYLACKAVDVPAEIHLYPRGGHGYGMRQSEFAVSGWGIHCATWLESMKVITN